MQQCTIIQHARSKPHARLVYGGWAVGGHNGKRKEGKGGIAGQHNEARLVYLFLIPRCTLRDQPLNSLSTREINGATMLVEVDLSSHRGDDKSPDCVVHSQGPRSSRKPDCPQ